MNNPTKAAGIEVRKAGDDVLVHDPVHDKVHVLNGTAGYVLELCDGTHSVADIARSLSDATGAEYDVVLRDIGGVVRDFEGLGLLVS